MPKITISSTRVYYKELSLNDALTVHHDIALYQSMLHKAYREAYLDHKINPKYLKNIYHTSDYLPLSAISEAKGILKSQKTWHKKTISMKKKQLSKIDKKIRQEEKLLKQYETTKSSLIYLSKAVKNNESPTSVYRCNGLSSVDYPYCIYNNRRMLLYLFEVQILNPLMKSARNKIKLLRYRRTRLLHRIEKLESKIKAICFKKNRYMKVAGRSQGKYCNNLFKYDYESKIMTYITTDKTGITFPLSFPYRGEELQRVLNLRHSTPGKSVCYTLVDKGEYFIIYATIELDIRYSDYIFDIDKGVVGIDINNDHIALSETDEHCNMIYCREIPFDLSKKLTNQRNWIIENTVNQVLDYCVNAAKPLIIEELNFEKKKKEFELYDRDKNYHRMLSEFSYRKIIEKLYSRSYKVGIGINEVNPAYTSVIGKLKYADTKGITVHKAASYVIARRGMGYTERLAKRIYGEINKPLLTRWRNYHQLISNI